MQTDDELGLACVQNCEGEGDDGQQETEPGHSCLLGKVLQLLPSSGMSVDKLAIACYGAEARSAVFLHNIVSFGWDRAVRVIAVR